MLRLSALHMGMAVGVTALALGLVSASSAPARPARVLIIYENESTLGSVIEIAEGLHDSLQASMPLKLEVYSEFLDTVRFPSAEYEKRLLDFLAFKYAGVAFDAVVVGGPGALQFALRHRAEIGANAPIVFGGVSQTSLQGKVLPPDVKGVVSYFDVRKTIDLARQLQPDARRIVVMTGSSEFDQQWSVKAHAALADSYGGLPVSYLSRLSIADFKAQAMKLPRQSILLILTIFEDGDGRKFIPLDAAREIAAVSGAPAYGVYSTFVGVGIVGGYVGAFRTVGEQMGALAARAAEGDLSGPQTSFTREGPLIDWSQILRWGIDPARIPKDADIQNYSQSGWEKYRTEILVLLSVVVLQSLTIAGLFLQRRRQRRLEAELALERLELSYLSRTSQLGELSGALAHELNQPLTAILANAEAASRLLDGDPLDLQELHAIVEDIILDDKRAATVITQLRRLMIRGETRLEHMDLNEAVNTTLALARSELIARQTRVEVMLDLPDVPIRGNLSQLQQVILNLILNATDAMRELPSSNREISIQTRKKASGLCELTVADSGVGIAPERRLEVFKPFVSTKKSGLGLGLAICRSIVQAHGGTLFFDEKFEKGAQAVLTLPTVEEDA